MNLGLYKNCTYILAISEIVIDYQSREKFEHIKKTFNNKKLSIV